MNTTAAAPTQVPAQTQGRTAVQLLEAAIDQVAALPANTPRALDANSLLEFTARLEELGRQIDGLRIAAAADIADRAAAGTAELGPAVGTGTAARLLEQVTGASTATVRRRIRLGRNLCQRISETGAALPAWFPIAGAAVARGRIGLDTAEAITRELSFVAPRTTVEALTAAEDTLVDAASGTIRPGEEHSPFAGIAMPADLIRDQARLWRDVLDPDGIEPAANQARERRDFWISRAPRNGVHRFTGAITSDIAGKLLAIFDAALSPHTRGTFASDTEDPTLQHGADQPGLPLPMDERSRGQQRADVFAAMICAFGGSDTFATPPAVLITATGTPASTETATGTNTATGADAGTSADSPTHAGTITGTGTISGVRGPVPTSMLRQAACDGGTQTVWLEPTGRVHALETAGRFFTTQQRRAIAARDGTTCLHPTCNIPATASEAHHVIPHSRGGPTSVDNGVLLCWWHHHLIDTGLLTITMVDGKPHITAPAWLTRTRQPRT